MKLKSGESVFEFLNQGQTPICRTVRVKSPDTNAYSTYDLPIDRDKYTRVVRPYKDKWGNDRGEIMIVKKENLNFDNET
jgi:hypothetical protein